MNWLFITVLSYLILAVVFLADKWLLVGPIKSPKVYVFYIGMLQIFVFLLIPFIDFLIPQPIQIFIALMSGVSFILALFWFYKGLQLYESSRIVPAVGGMVPIFSALLIYIFSKGKNILKIEDFIAFLILILGSILITYQKGKNISLESLKISSITAIFLSLYMILAKYAYLEQTFLSGFVWVRSGSFLAAILFLLFFRKEILGEIFEKKKLPPKKTTAIFFINQSAGAGANILQNWAIALAPLVFVPVISALQGVQYAFLLILIVFLSLKFPKILNEEISKKIIFQKVIAILLIGGGLAILTLK